MAAELTGFQRAEASLLAAKKANECARDANREGDLKLANAYSTIADLLVTVAELSMENERLRGSR